MKQFKITLKDNGQDLLWFVVDEDGIVVEAGPFHNETYKGAYIPYDHTTAEDGEPLFQVGKPLPIHHPPHLTHTWLKFDVEEIKEVSNKVNPET